MDKEAAEPDPVDRKPDGEDPNKRTIVVGIPVDINLETIPGEGFLATAKDFTGIFVLEKDPHKAAYIVADRVRHQILEMLYEEKEPNEQPSS